MTALLVAPLALQAAAMLVDELWFHRRRGLPKWERIGHPLDTATVLACYLLCVLRPPTPGALRAYAALAIGSCLFVTKDEPIHARRCEAGEQWLHAVLFVLHPVTLGAVALLWIAGAHAVVVAQAALTVAFGAYQAIYWNVARRGRWSRTLAR